MPTRLKTVSITLTDPQYEKLRRIATERGIFSLSTFIRMTLVESLELPTNGHHNPKEVKARNG